MWSFRIRRNHPAKCFGPSVAMTQGVKSSLFRPIGAETLQLKSRFNVLLPSTFLETGSVPTLTKAVWKLQVDLGLFWKSRKFLASPQKFLCPNISKHISNSQRSLKTVRAQPHLTPNSPKAGALFALKALSKGHQSLQLWTGCCAKGNCIPSSDWEDSRLGLVFSHWEKDGQSLQCLYLHMFSLNQIDHFFAVGFGRRQESFFPPPLLRGTQDKPGLHSQRASLQTAHVLAKTHQQQARHSGAREGVYKNCPYAYFSFRNCLLSDPGFKFVPEPWVLKNCKEYLSTSPRKYPLQPCTLQTTNNYAILDCREGWVNTQIFSFFLFLFFCIF